MTKIKINSIIWEEWNIEHIKKHRVQIEEVVDAGNHLIFHRKTIKDRYLAVGRSGTRLLTLIVKRKGLGKYYLVTAFDTAKKDRRKVKNEKSNKK